jgi:ABC-2 type transport system permease protein
MRFFNIAVKDWKEIKRDKKGLIFILLFPVLLLIISGLFLSVYQGSRPYDIAVINYDQGSTLTNGSIINYGNTLSQSLNDSLYQNSNTHLFNVVSTNESNANQLLNNGKIDAELIIPENFSDATVAMINNIAQTTTDPNSSATTPNITSSLIIRGDFQSNNFGVTQSILTGVINTYQDKLVTQTQTDTLGTSIAEPTDYVNTIMESNNSEKSSNNLIPDILIFSILLISIMVAVGLTREEESGGLSRLKLSKIGAFDLLLGGFISWTLIVVIQILLLLTLAIILSSNSLIEVNSILLVLITGIIGGLASISLGIIIAAFTKTTRQATGLGIILIIPITFIAVYQLPQTVIPKIGGYNFKIINLLPWTHVFNALQTALLGGGWSVISYEVIFAVFLTLIFFIVSMVLYSLNKFKGNII